MFRTSYSRVNRLLVNMMSNPRLILVNTTQPARFLNYKPIETSNKITLGHKMTQVIEKKREKYLLKKSTEQKYSVNNTRPNRKLLIAAFRPELNHYTDQAYRDFSDRNLASYGWKGRQSGGQYFTINSIGTHPSLIDPNRFRTEDDQIIDFSSLNLNECLVSKLKSAFGILRPTFIQYQTLVEILNRENHILAIAETGGGKTLCYTLPILEYAVRVRHQVENRLQLKRDRFQPIGLVLVPTRELAFQVYDTFKRLVDAKLTEPVSDEQKSYLGILDDINVVLDLHPGQIRAREMVLNHKIESLDGTTKPADIIITMPGQLEDRLDSNRFDSTYLRAMVVDEADTLFDDSFSPVTLKCLTKLKMNLTLPTIRVEKPSTSDYTDPEEKKVNFYLQLDEKIKDPSTQLIFTSATIPRDLKRVLEESFDWRTQLKTIQTNRVNRLMLHVPQKFIRTNGTKRPFQLLELIRKELAKSHKSTTMVFCYKSITAIYVYKFLRENGIHSVNLLTKKLNNNEREKVVNEFFNGTTRVLVCTDIASRGWNTVQVNHVINFEMPFFIADYLHRVGRVGRLGSKVGLVTNYVVKKMDVDLVWNIERSIRLGTELTDVDANIKRLFERHAFEEVNSRNRGLPEEEKVGEESSEEEGESSEGEKPDEVTLVGRRNRSRRVTRT